MRNPKWHRDEIILALDLYFRSDIGAIDARNPKIIALSALLNKLPLFSFKPDAKTFRNPNGVTLKLSNFKALDPAYGGKGMDAYSRLDKEVFDEFRGKIPLLHEVASNIKQIAEDAELSQQIANIEEDEVSSSDCVKEGQVLYKLHKVIERDRSIVEAKKKKVLGEKGELRCEACTFNFEVTYGRLGKNFIECHHLVPLSNFQISKITTVDDLALLCSNCHRMIHKDLNVSISEFKSRWINCIK